MAPPQPPPVQPGPPPGFGLQPPPTPPPPSNAPSPIGLAVAGVGLALLCVSMLLPRVKIDDPEGSFSFYSYSGLLGFGGFGIDTSTVVLSVALVAAVGLSAHRNPAMRWPARIAAIGTAALTAAFAYHPVTLMRQYAENTANSESYDEFGEETTAAEVDISAENGVYLAVIAVALLALSTFFMQARRRTYLLPVQPYQQPVPAGRPGADATITVNPG